MPTFAFSHTGDYWKTKYSFEPTSYTHVDNKLISYRGTSAIDPEYEGEFAQLTAWQHNSQSVPRNNFYGEQFNSNVVVSSNQDPSAEKVFNSVSLETNQNNFSAQVLTNVDIQDSSVTKIQVSTIENFIAKEENLYSDISPSVLNSTTNLRGVGLVKAYDATSNTITLYGNVPNVPVGAIPVFARTVNEETILTTNVNASGTQAVINTQQFGDDVSAFLQLALLSEADIGDATSVISSADYNGFETIVQIGGIGLLAGDYIIPDNTRLLALLDPSIHGDAIRGKYMMLNVSTKDGALPFELYAINVDYSFSNLDSRLGQNS